MAEWELEWSLPDSSKACEHVMVTSLQMVGGKPIQQKGAGTEEELAEVKLGWRGGPGCGDLWARGRCPDGGQEMGTAPSLPYVHPDISAGGPSVCPHFLGRTLSYREGTDLAQVLIAGRTKIWVITTLGSLRLLSCDLGLT